MLFNPVFANYMQAYGRGGIERTRSAYRDALAALLVRWSSLIDTPGDFALTAQASLGREISYCLDSPTRTASTSTCCASCRRATRSTRTGKRTVIRDFEQLFEATAPDFIMPTAARREPHALGRACGRSRLSPRHRAVRAA
jgi:phenylalanine-4-hydroxylase